MNSFKTLFLTKSIAAACVALGAASPAAAQIPVNIGGTPNDGLACRAVLAGAWGRNS